MLLTQVNRVRAFCGVLFAVVACTPSGTSTAGAESAKTGTRATATAPLSAAQDSSITLADVARTDGSATAPVWVIVVSDFQCPYCKQWHDATYPALHNEFVKTGKVRVAYVNYPLRSHAQAWPSAEAAMCAGVQRKFWQMHDGIFDTQEKWAAAASPAAIFDSVARARGVEINRWRQCVASGATKALIQADQQRAEAAGVRSTPTILIGDERMAGAHPIESIRRAIDSALVKTRRQDSSRQ